MRAIANIEKFTPGTRLKSWLFTIMRNAFYTRAKRAAREAPGAMDCASARPVTEAPQEWSVRGKEMQVALGELPEQQREVVVLIGMLGLSYEEAAEIAGCAVGTIKSRLNRARLRLYEYFGETTAEGLLEPTARHFIATLPESPAA